MAKDSILILLAAEDPPLRETLKLLLNEQLGIWDIVIAASGTEALEKIKNSSGQTTGMSALLGGMTASTTKKCGFDLALMDWNLDGGEFTSLKAIRKLYDRKTLPVFLITKQRDKEEIQAALVAGATNFLFTPISADLLNKKFQEVLGRKLGFKAQAALSVFQKQEGKEKREDDKKSDIKAPILTGGASYHAKRAVTEEEAKFAVSLFLSPADKVDGHFHRFVDVVGGGKNCYWAREIISEEGETAIELEYLTPKGKASGHHASTIPKKEFMASFYICTVENCALARASTVSTDAGPSSSLIDGHYQEKLKSGATNCLWARERTAGGPVDLEYVTPKGAASGMTAKTVSKEKFLQTFVPCTVDNCPIIKAVTVPPSPKTATETAPSPPLPSTAPVQKIPESEEISVAEGHYQETIDKGSNIKKCVWAKEVVRDGKKIIQAFLIGPKGRSSGIHDRYVTTEDFLRRFTLCTKENCDILRRQ